MIYQPDTFDNGAKELYDELILKLKSFNKSTKNFSIDTRLRIVARTIGRLREEVNKHQFSSEEEETRFFKKVLPRFLSLLIYYAERINLESVQLVGSTKSRFEYFERQYRKIDDFFKDNVEFLKYYRSGKTDMDRFYFLRNSSPKRENMDLLTTVMDTSFCTVHCIKVATFLAYIMFYRDIRNILAARHHDTMPEDKNEKLKWTDPKRGMIELMYSLKELGAFNNGKATLKQIKSYFEKVFLVELGNSSSSAQGLLSRHESLTSYIDKLKTSLHSWADRNDDKRTQ